MADKKISQLDDIVLILGDEKIPVSTELIPNDNAAVTPNSLMQFIVDQLGLDGVIIHCGDYNATLQLFPNSGGTGSGGSVRKHNEFDIITGSLDANILPVGSTIRAKKHNPSISDPADWRIFY